jgi:hypothetical protein
METSQLSKKFQNCQESRKYPMRPQGARGKAQGEKANMFRSRDLRSPGPEREDGRDFWKSLSKWLNSYKILYFPSPNTGFPLFIFTDHRSVIGIDNDNRGSPPRTSDEWIH